MVETETRTTLPAWVYALSAASAGMLLIGGLKHQNWPTVSAAGLALAWMLATKTLLEAQRLDTLVRRVTHAPVKMSCDAPQCDSWTIDQIAMIEDWFTVVTDVDSVYRFCCGWCMTRWGADRFEPTEVIE